MSFPQWSLFLGLLLVSMVLASALLVRVPFSSAMGYLALGWLLGPSVADVLHPDPTRFAAGLERLAEGALLISLFAVGMQLGVPLRDPRWRLPLRLATLSMCAMAAMVAAAGVFLLKLPLGAAILLGAILAPTDPVLASGVRSEPGTRPDRLGFSLAGEGGLNDGTAYPIAMLGLGLLGLHDLGPGLARWGGIDLLWSLAGGLLIGAALGAMTGRTVVHLRTRHGATASLDEFLGLGLIALAHGAAQLCRASGFLAVFAAGLALQRVREQHLHGPTARGGAKETSTQHASAMRDSVQLFNEQLEKIAELALVLMVGAMLGYARPLPAAAWFIPLVLLVMRPLSVAAALSFVGTNRPQRAMIGWFGIRGIGSVYYLLFAIRHGLDARVADTLVSLTLWTVAFSIVVHGATAQPLMLRYLRWRRARDSRRRRAP